MSDVIFAPKRTDFRDKQILLEAFARFREKLIPYLKQSKYELDELECQL